MRRGSTLCFLITSHLLQAFVLVGNGDKSREKKQVKQTNKQTKTQALGTGGATHQTHFPELLFLCIFSLAFSFRFFPNNLSRMIPHFVKNLQSFLQSYNKSLINQACSGPYWENIGSRSFLYGPRCARSVLSRPRADILPVRPSRLVNKIYLLHIFLTSSKTESIISV